MGKYSVILSEIAVFKHTPQLFFFFQFHRGLKTRYSAFHWRGNHLSIFIGTKESIYIRKKSNSHIIIVGHQHGRRPAIWKTNMVAVTSHVKTLYLEKQIDQKGPARTRLLRRLLI